MRGTNIADLRNHLTRYLKEVRAGEEIVIRDRQVPLRDVGLSLTWGDRRMMGDAG
jgi:antitoxin (DNA-binding transcriptional repressor) of toxin-antitoxin stability system